MPTPFRYRRLYRGPVEAVIFDWAGTIVDHGSLAPAAVFVEVFRRRGIAISIDEARAPMGIAKRAHIAEIAAMDGVRRRWAAAHGGPPGEAAIDAMYGDFVPLQLACLAEHAALIPGARETIAALRARGCRIATTTGYSAEMNRCNLVEAARQGVVPDHAVAASDVAIGRPSPQMCLASAIALGVTTVQACVKVDDTAPGIAEGLNAGMWTVAVAMSGNELGLSAAALAALPADERAARRRRAYERLYAAGAHEVIDSVADLMPCIAAIEARLARGEVP